MVVGSFVGAASIMDVAIGAFAAIGIFTSTLFGVYGAWYDSTSYEKFALVHMEPILTFMGSTFFKGTDLQVPTLPKPNSKTPTSIVPNNSLPTSPTSTGKILESSISPTLMPAFIYPSVNSSSLATELDNPTLA